MPTGGAKGKGGDVRDAAHNSWTGYVDSAGGYRDTDQIWNVHLRKTYFDASAGRMSGEFNPFGRARW